jgi:hypothetical protein
MAKITTNITKASYMLKRLRDCGYKADKIIGATDPVSLDKDLGRFIHKLFPDGKNFGNVEICETFKTFKTEFIRFTNTCPNYTDRDSRVWTILIDGGRDNVFLTFYRNYKDVEEEFEQMGNDYFEIYDGGQYVKPLRKRLSTQSMEVIIQELNDMGITKKFSDK